MADSLAVELLDASGSRVEVGPVSSAQIKVLVLDGHFDKDDFHQKKDKDDWTEEYFNRRIVQSKRHKEPLLKGNCEVYMCKGLAFVGNLAFNECSDWTNSGSFRLGAQVANNIPQGIRIVEAVSMPIKVRSRRHSKRDKTPKLEDDISCLVNIFKGGEIYRRLVKMNITKVKDFLQLYHSDKMTLHNITGFSIKKWEEVFHHANRCKLTDDCYVMYDDAVGVELILNCVFDIVKVTFKGQSNQKYQLLDEHQKELADKVRRIAYEKQSELVKTACSSTNEIPESPCYTGFMTTKAYFNAVRDVEASGKQKQTSQGSCIVEYRKQKKKDEEQPLPTVSEDISFSNRGSTSVDPFWVPDLRWLMDDDGMCIEKQQKEEDEVYTVSEFSAAACDRRIGQVHFPSTPWFNRPYQFTFQKLLASFNDVLFNTIGIIGSTGIGKTSVMRSFFSHCEQRKLFDLVLWVTVSRCTSRRNMQNALAAQLQLTVQTFKSDEEVAKLLHDALEARNFVLCLDDVREYINLEEAGVPLPSQNQNCKIILTTRSLNVCHTMKVDNIIDAAALSTEEALQLFHFHAGAVMDSRDISSYALMLVEQCNGVPLALKIVGSALRMDENILTWKLALKKLLLSDIMGILELGYDRLNENDVKSCFLYSALCTKAKPIKVSHLEQCLIEEGIVSGIVSKARVKASAVIKNLVDACLLEFTDDGSMISMHDTIRYLALSILLSDKGIKVLLSHYFSPMLSQEKLPFDTIICTTETGLLSCSEGQPSILRACDGLKEAPAEEEWTQSRIICLTDNTYSSLPEGPDCSKLVSLFLQRNNSLRTIPTSFFDRMSCLQVLNLSKTRIKCLPHSVSKLERLEFLILRHCERLFSLPTIIGSLTKLVGLDLHGTQINQLPDQIRQLLTLTHLNVCFYGSIDQHEYAILPAEVIPKGIIANLSQLTELNITVFPGDPRWIKCMPDILEEVSKLNVHALSIHFLEIMHLEYFIDRSPSWADCSLTRFKFIVGRDVKRLVSHISDHLKYEYDQLDKCVRFVDGDDIPEAIGDVLSQATAFYLDHHLAIHFLTQFGLGNIKNLKFCIVVDCPRLKALVDGRKLEERCFQHLEHLSIHYAWNLSRIFVEPICYGSFSILRRLSIHSCPKLKFVFSASMVATLSSLEELTIEDCQRLKNVVINQDPGFLDDDISDSYFDKPSETGHDDMICSTKTIGLFNTAYLKLKVLKLHYLPKLENIWDGGNWPPVEHMSFYNCPRLANLYLGSHVELSTVEIQAETSWWNTLHWDGISLLQKLEGRVKEFNHDD